MAGRLFLQPHLTPTIKKLERYGKAFRPNFTSVAGSRTSLTSGMETRGLWGVAAQEW